MLLQLIRVVLGGCQGKTGGNDTLDPGNVNQLSSNRQMDIRRVIRKVKEESDALHATILFEISREEAASLHINTHGGEYDREVFLVAVMNILRRLIDQASLSTNLGSNFIVRKTGGRENRNLLASGNGVHGVDGGDTGGDHFLGVNLRTISHAADSLRKRIPSSRG